MVLVGLHRRFVIHLLIQKEFPQLDVGSIGWVGWGASMFLLQWLTEQFLLGVLSSRLHNLVVTSVNWVEEFIRRVGHANAMFEFRASSRLMTFQFRSDDRGLDSAVY